jgi:LytTr DNA-binding domain-containing protein
MSACAIQTLARPVPLTLGLRVGIFGSEAFTTWVRGVIQVDSDVASVKTWMGLAACAANPSLDLAILEVNHADARLSNELVEALAAFSLIGVIGSRPESLATLENLTTVDMSNPDWWLQLKQQTVQRRLQEFCVLINALADNAQRSSPGEQTLTLENGGSLRDVPVSSVDWIRSAGNYVEVRVDGRSHLLRSEMHAMQSRLTRAFLRIHRKMIINMQRVVRIEADNTRMFAVLTTGERFAVSRARRHLVRSRWEADNQGR